MRNQRQNPRTSNEEFGFDEAQSFNDFEPKVTNRKEVRRMSSSEQGFWDYVRTHPKQTGIGLLTGAVAISFFWSSITGKTSDFNDLSDLFNPVFWGSLPGAIVGNGVRSLDSQVVTPINSNIEEGDVQILVGPPPGEEGSLPGEQ